MVLLLKDAWWNGSSPQVHPSSLKKNESCLALCDPMDCSPPGSSAHGIFQARILEWIAIRFSRGSSRPRDQTQVFHIVGRFFTIWATREPQMPLAWPLPNSQRSFFSHQEAETWQRPGGRKCWSSQLWSQVLNSAPLHHTSLNRLGKGTFSCEKPLKCRDCFSNSPSSVNAAGAAATAKSLQSCLTLCDPIDGSPPGSPVPGSLQVRTLEWVAISFSNAWKWKVKVKSLSCVRLFTTPWTAAHQAPPSRQEYWSGVPSPSPQLTHSHWKKKLKGMAPHSSIFSWEILDRGAWRATNHVIAKRGASQSN